jgi:hypothetical protein
MSKQPEKSEPKCGCCGRGYLRTEIFDPREPGPVLEVKCSVCGWKPDNDLTADLSVPSTCLGGEAAYVAGYQAGIHKAISHVADLFGRRFCEMLRKVLG